MEHQAPQRLHGERRAEQAGVARAKVVAPEVQLRERAMARAAHASQALAVKQEPRKLKIYRRGPEFLLLGRLVLAVPHQMGAGKHHTLMRAQFIAMSMEYQGNK